MLIPSNHLEPPDPLLDMVLRRYRYRIEPDADQIVHIEHTFSACRRVYNVLLEQSMQAYEDYLASPTTMPKPELNAYYFSSQVTVLRNNPDYKWLKTVSSTAIQRAGMQLAKAYTNFFRRLKKYQATGKGSVGYPKFHSKEGKQGYQLTKGGFSVENQQLYIAKLHTGITVRWSRKLPPNPSSVTITRTPSGKYFVSFVVLTPKRASHGQDIVAVDQGLTTRATVYDGTRVTKIPNPRHYVNALRYLRRLQKSVSRKQKGSNNRRKARLRLARCHERIANLRLDYHHKLTTKLITTNEAVCIEDLNTKGMASNSRLSKHIMDAGFGMFRKLLEEKAQGSTDTKILKADRYYPSTNMCSHCFTRPIPKLDMSVKRWTCTTCHTTHDRDGNAAINLHQLAISERPIWSLSDEPVVRLPRYTQATA